VNAIGTFLLHGSARFASFTLPLQEYDAVILRKRLDEVEMETDGELDLRGVLGLDKSVITGYKKLHYRVRLKGNGTREQCEEVQRAMMAASPHYNNMTHGIKLNTELIIDRRWVFIVG
jgi:hypothetical protein